MRVLLDTNLLLRLSDESHSMHADALATIARLDEHDHDCVIVPQVLYEYWVVATRPLENNGLGMDTDLADLAISKWMTVFRLMLDERGVFGLWRELVAVNEVKGKTAHDARLVAAMKRHEVWHLITFNTGDFIRFPEIQVFSPASILAGKFPS